MKHFAAIAIIVGTVCCAGGAQAELPAAFDNCRDAKTPMNWCAPRLTSEGWKLKYQSESPHDSKDGYWLYEVWGRDKSVVVCVFGTYGSLRMHVHTNHCQGVSEVSG